jgi:hypothetical protein
MSGFAQSDTIRQSGIHLLGGAIHNRMVDTGLTFNRQAFSGTSFKFFAGYDRRRNNSILLASFEINGGNVKMGGESVTGKITNAQLAGSYLFKAASFKFLNSQSTFYVGPKLGAHAIYILTPQLDNETFLAAYGLYLQAFQHIPLNKSSFLDASVSLPVIGFSKRIVLDGGLYQPESEELVSILFDDSTLSYPRIIEFHTGYSKRLSRLTWLSFRYRFAYLTNSNFGELNFYSNEVLVGFKFYFKYE